MGARGVAEGRRQAATRQIEAEGRDLLPWEPEGLTRVQRVIAFLEYLPVTKGILEGENMRLLPNQIALIREIYGRLDEYGRCTAIASIARGNGKSGLLSGLALCHLLGPEAERRGAIYSAATDKEQAAILFGEMEAIIWERPRFEEICNIVRHKKLIEVLDGPGEGSEYRAMSRDATKAHGLAPSCWIYDELAQTKDRE